MGSRQNGTGQTCRGASFFSLRRALYKTGQFRSSVPLNNGQMRHFYLTNSPQYNYQRRASPALSVRRMLYDIENEYNIHSQKRLIARLVLQSPSNTCSYFVEVQHVSPGDVWIPFLLTETVLLSKEVECCLVFLLCRIDGAARRGAAAPRRK